MKGSLHIPTPDGFLDPITRRSVISLARRNRMTALERRLEPDEFSGATEAFVARTAAEVTAAREIGSYRLAPAAITETLMKDYNRLVFQPPQGITRVTA
ncbi:hypothetical protein [Rhodopila sp.]|uniref:hypothetical protein n=1 Tax=Rhodopila sp. TaxID=2480087 RepID=UPI003D128498